MKEHERHILGYYFPNQIEVGSITIISVPYHSTPHDIIWGGYNEWLKMALGKIFTIQGCSTCYKFYLRVYLIVSCGVAYTEGRIHLMLTI